MGREGVQSRMSPVGDQSGYCIRDPTLCPQFSLLSSFLPSSLPSGPQLVSQRKMEEGKGGHLPPPHLLSARPSVISTSIKDEGHRNTGEIQHFSHT